jgi:RNA polymerase sigma-70 factor, ECF subfamily
MTGNHRSSCFSSAHRTLDLLQRVRAGDRSVENALFERYTGRVLFLVRRRLHEPLRRRLESMDIVQEVFAEACVKLPEFDPLSHGAFYLWLKAIVERKILEAYRHNFRQKRSAKKEVPLQTGESGDAQGGIPGVSDPHLATRLHQKEAVARLEHLLGGLRPSHREALVLWYFEGLNPAEIAERTGRTQDACRVMVVRALASLGRRFRKRVNLGAC